MLTIIAGSRTIHDYELLKTAISLSGYKITGVVCGEASGVDSLGKRYAKEKNIPIHSYPADWERYGKKAGYIRNQQMVDIASQCLILYDGSSKGTKITIDLWNKKHGTNNLFILYLSK